MNPLRLFDAHNHLHDPRLDPHRAEMSAALRAIGFAGAVVNGTTEADWPAVAALVASDPRLVPSFGLHPWYIRTRSPAWLEHLASNLEAAGPRVALGEIGLDAWIPEHDLAAQREVICAQLAVATTRDLPVTIHCIRAWAPLLDTLRTTPLPGRGFLLHAYGGPAGMVGAFARLGAYFSFNPAHLAASKQARRDIFRTIPVDRLLVETDAPAMPPPSEYNRHPLPADVDGQAVNHPANLAVAYEELARLRAIPLETLAAQVEENFHRLFG